LRDDRAPALRFLLTVAVFCLGSAKTSTADGACGPLPPPSGNVIDVGPGQVAQLSGIVAAADSGDTIRLADGYYPLQGALLAFTTPGVTLRSLSGNRGAVVLDNNYQGGDLIAVAASGVTIADITVTRAYYHPIHVAPWNGAVENTLIHNVAVVDPGQQGIKINPNAGFFADNGVIRCSRIELTDQGRPNIRDGCYTGGVDGHRSWGWRIHDNEIAGFWCPTGLSEHGIHFWTGSRDTIIERNTLTNNARAIGFGLGLDTPGRTYSDSPCPGVTTAGHFRGIVRNNFIVANDDRLFDQGSGGFDAGIALEQVCNAEVVHNSVFSTRAPFSSIEWRFAGNAGRIANNLVSHNLRPRDGASATLAGNLANAPASLVVDLASAGDLHLRSDASAAIDQGVVLPAGIADEDIDGELRGAAPDVGADELGGTFADVPRSHWAWAFIEALSRAGVTSGCATNPLRYCPEGTTTRAQMAVFLLRAREGGSYTPPACTVPTFTDVPCSDPYSAWIGELAARGITSGCGVSPPLYCPSSTVTRASMAVFLLRALLGGGYAPPPASGDFDDAPPADPFAAWIEELAARGVTSGCNTNPPRYCPASPVTRAQMAVFLVRTFSLPM